MVRRLMLLQNSSGGVGQLDEINTSKDCTFYVEYNAAYGIVPLRCSVITLQRLHFPGRYKLSGRRLCACAINVKSSVCSETQSIGKYHGLFVRTSKTRLDRVLSESPRCAGRFRSYLFHSFTYKCSCFIATIFFTIDGAMVFPVV